MDNLELFFEATALEIYNTSYKGKLESPQTYLTLLSADPTSVVAEGTDPESILEKSKKGRFVDWIVRQYLKASEKQRFLSEDLSLIPQALKLYIELTRNKESQAQLIQAITQSQLSIKNPLDINSYSRETLLVIVQPFMNQSAETISTKEEDKVKVVFEDEYWQVVIPLTFAASRKYGTGTGWCTATSNSSYYDNYSKQGSLVILKFKPDAVRGKKDCKWQYHQPSHQFKDYTDRGISIFSIADRFIEDKKVSPEIQQSTLQMFAAMRQAGWEAFDARRIVDKVNYDYDLVNKALAVSSDITTAQINIDIGERNITYESPLIFAVDRQNIELLNELLELDVSWRSDVMMDALASSLEINDPELFGNLLKKVYDKPLALTSNVSGTGTCLLVLCMVKGYNWLNTCLQSLLPREQRSALLKQGRYRDSVIFCDALRKGGKKNEVALASVVPLISTVLHPERAATALQEARLVIPAQDIPDYFLIGDPTPLRLAAELGCTEVVEAIQKVLSESGAQTVKERGLIIASSKQFSELLTQKKEIPENAKVSVSNFYIWRSLYTDEVKKADRTIPLFTIPGLWAALSMMDEYKKHQKLISTFILKELEEHQEIIIHNTESFYTENTIDLQTFWEKVATIVFAEILVQETTLYLPICKLLLINAPQAFTKSLRDEIREIRPSYREGNQFLVDLALIPDLQPLVTILKLDIKKRIKTQINDSTAVWNMVTQEKEGHYQIREDALNLYLTLATPEQLKLSIRALKDIGVYSKSGILVKETLIQKIKEYLKVLK